ncbi:hypothetical protein [Brevundimonas sp.]|uniref:hypothetical protein n=1 Tax=Brevundimonas sp. TaxID=1871086 RepID=UPI002D3A04E0|nr:hypothetical protein [Brevundimonas sp.]HYD26942.1 hypothetical protein [Brevundimonas sp.]
MGHRNKDRWTLADWRPGHESVGAMLRSNWEVLAECDHCRRKRIVRLGMIVRFMGPEVSLWNRRSRCYAYPPCPGFEHFSARPPGAVQYFRLEGRDPPV